MTIFWIGGAPDAGKTTLARALALRIGAGCYEYDRTDATHHAALAAAHADIREFMAASLEARWVEPSPEALCARALRSFRLRWPLVLKDLASLQVADRLLVAEGFGLLPEFVATQIESPRQALWLIPTESLKQASWSARGKPSFKARLAHPERGAANLLARDQLLGDEIGRQAAERGLKVIVNDGTLSPEGLLKTALEWFGQVIQALSPVQGVVDATGIEPVTPSV